jgi:hypothetical protein
MTSVGALQGTGEFAALVRPFAIIAWVGDLLGSLIRPRRG